MARLPRTSGFTLLECMIAMAVLVLGSLGALSIQRIGVRMNADARTMGRATALAQDLIDQMQTWDYSDARLCAKGEVGCSSGRTNDLIDSTAKFEEAGDPVPSELYDHSEAELADATWSGVASTSVQQLGFTRFWNVEAADYDSNGALTGKRVAVIVRWVKEGRNSGRNDDAHAGAAVGRRIVIVTYLKDPSVTN